MMVIRRAVIAGMFHAFRFLLGLRKITSGGKLYTFCIIVTNKIESS